MLADETVYDIILLDISLNQNRDSGRLNGMKHDMKNYIADMDAFDLNIILNNALNNALEACRRQKEGKMQGTVISAISTRIFWNGAVTIMMVPYSG